MIKQDHTLVGVGSYDNQSSDCTVDRLTELNTILSYFPPRFDQNCQAIFACCEHVCVSEY